VTLIEISCEEVWRELSNYIDDDVSTELRARMDAHFRKCNHCTAILDGTTNVVQLIGDFQAFDIPRGFSERLKARISGAIKNH
jgi:hypothetical protein